MTQDIGDWATYLSDEKNKDYFDSLLSFLNSRVGHEIYPPRGTWFKAFEYSSFSSTKVVILGQDPYHGEGQAEGLSFSVPKGMLFRRHLETFIKSLIKMMLTLQIQGMATSKIGPNKEFYF